MAPDAVALHRDRGGTGQPQGPARSYAGDGGTRYQGKRLPSVTLDVDSASIEVHCPQPKAEWNGHYNARVYHPLITSIAETSDMLDARLRAGILDVLITRNLQTRFFLLSRSAGYEVNIGQINVDYGAEAYSGKRQPC